MLVGPSHWFPLSCHVPSALQAEDEPTGKHGDEFKQEPQRRPSSRGVPSRGLPSYSHAGLADSPRAHTARFRFPEPHLFFAMF